MNLGGVRRTTLSRIECSSSNSSATLVAPRSGFEALAEAAGAEPTGLLTVGSTPLGRGLIVQQVGQKAGQKE